MQKKASELLCSTAFFLLVLAFLPCAVFTRDRLHLIWHKIKAAALCCILTILQLLAVSQRSNFVQILKKSRRMMLSMSCSDGLWCLVRFLSGENDFLTVIKPFSQTSSSYCGDSNAESRAEQL